MRASNESRRKANPMRSIQTLLQSSSTPRYVARNLVIDAGAAVGYRREELCAELYALREHVRLVLRDGGLSLEISDALHALETSSAGPAPTCP
jgi:hypothetical protein